MSDVYDLLWEQLARDKQITAQLRKRRSDSYEVSVKHALVSEHVDDGWEIVKELKFKTKLKKSKSKREWFTDQVWALFADMGFHALNREQRFLLPYSSSNSQEHPVEVFAVDDEIAVIVECRVTESGPKKGNFKKAIETLNDRRKGLINSAKRLLENNELKVVFVLATYGYFLTEPDRGRLEESNIQYFDKETVDYYRDLLKHLGTAARYQLEANLFPGQKIPALNSQVPAIRGKMGGHTYYSFMVEPVKLLKLGYILHRSKANKNLMPTYQRLIKRPRLRAIRAFIDKGGFFPNSIIVNIESNRAPKFDLASKQVEGTQSRVGILHLPMKYRTLFIIDGQHRLYGYSDTNYSSKHTVPVVAFHNLEREEQVRIFMEINENQKAVPKNLRHTLNADLKWDSESVTERVTALKLQIAQDLGEDMSSPLYDRIIVGENTRTNTRTITLDAVKQGLDKGSFFGEYTRSSMKKSGTFFDGDNDKAYQKLFPFLVDMFTYLQLICEKEWDRSAKDGGLLIINIGVNSVLRLFSDIVDHVVAEEGRTVDDLGPQLLGERCSALLEPIGTYFDELEELERSKIRKAYGTGGPTRFWRILQKVVADSVDGFLPDGIQQYWTDESKAYNTQSFEMIRDIEEFLNRDFKKRLQEKHGSQWFKKGTPITVYESSTTLAAQKNREIVDESEEKEPWDCLHIIDYRKIALAPGNWKDIFEEAYTKPGEEKISGGAKAKTKWFEKLNKIRNDTDHEYSVKQSEFEFLKSIHEWLITNR